MKKSLKTFAFKQISLLVVFSFLLNFMVFPPVSVYADEGALDVLQNDLENLFDYASQKNSNLEGRINGGKMLRIGTVYAEEEDKTDGEQDAENLREGIDIDWLMLEMGDVGNIQDFLETQPGSLKDYTDLLPPKYMEEPEVKAGRLIQYANDNSETTAMIGAPFSYGTPEEMLMVIIELKSQAITGTGLTQTVLGFTKEEIEANFAQLYENQLTLDRWMDEGDPEIFYQIYYLNAKIGYEKYKYKTTEGVKDTRIYFKDGTNLKLEDRPEVAGLGRTYADVFAIKKTLASMADSQEQWEQWIGYGEGSFFQIYSDFFGFPMRLFETQTTLQGDEPEPTVQTNETIQPPAEDFLKWAYNKNKHSYFTSFFDHSKPDYSKNDKLVTFTGDVFDSVYPTRRDVVGNIIAANNITDGYNSYDGHNGI